MSTTNTVTIIFQESGCNRTGHILDCGNAKERNGLVKWILFLFAQAGGNAKIKTQLIDLLDFGSKTENVKTDELVNNPSWQRVKWTSSVGTIWIGL